MSPEIMLHGSLSLSTGRCLLRCIIARSGAAEQADEESDAGESPAFKEVVAVGRPSWLEVAPARFAELAFSRALFRRLTTAGDIGPRP